MGATHVNSIQPGAPQPSSDIQTQKPFVGFQPGNVPPSQAIYLQLNDYIIVRNLANVASQLVTFCYRYLTPQGDIKEGTLPLSFQTSITQATFQIGEGWLLSFGFTSNAYGPEGSWAHVQVILGRFIQGGQPTFLEGVIWQGYVYPSNTGGWPNAIAKESIDGAGQLRVVAGTTPGVGADINEVVPGNRRWQLLSFQANLVTSATVANRQVTFDIDDGGVNQFGISGALAAQVASTTTRYTFAPGLTPATDAFGDGLIAAPNPLVLKAGHRIKTFTFGLQAGDQWSQPKYLILEWGAYDA